MPVIPSRREADIRRITGPGQPRQKCSGNLGMIAYVYHPSDSGKSKTGKLISRLTWAKSETLSQK
jgi:hypothetical protein